MTHITNTSTEESEKVIFAENLRAFYAGTTPQHDDIATSAADKAAAQSVHDREANDLIDEIDRALSDPTYQAPTPHLRDDLTPEFLADLHAQKEPIVHVYKSRFDKVAEERAALAEVIEGLSPEMKHLLPSLQHQYDEVMGRYRLWLKRSTDDHWRKIEAADRQRAEDPESYNATRRIRPVVNVVTAKTVLATETPEQKKVRLLTRKSELEAQRRAAETPEQAAARKARDAKSRAAKREAKKAASQII